jgi:DNA gyrase subunit A
MAIRFKEDRVRAMGRTARGVRGIQLREDDMNVGMALLTPDSTATVVTVCERGHGKRTDAAEFGEQHRGGIGLIAIKTSERNGLVVSSRVVEAGDELMLITDVGKVIRMGVDDIPVIGRNTQGVRLIRLEENERVVAVERLAERDERDHRLSSGGTHEVEIARSTLLDGDSSEVEEEEGAEEEVALQEVDETSAEDERGETSAMEEDAPGDGSKDDEGQR